MIGRNDPCFCGSGKKYKKCCSPKLPTPSREDLKELYRKRFQIHLKTPDEIEGIRKACKFTANVLKKTCEMAKAGVTTKELDTYANQLITQEGAISACKDYGEHPFPGHICTSLNEVICHGIPDDRPLVDGDILNIDIATILNSYYGDCSAMVMIGDVPADKKRVVETSKECLERAIKILGPNVPLNEIGRVIEEYATEQKCSVVTQFVGHGVGVDFHEAPQVPHYYSNLDIPLAPGMTFTIEPMINLGVSEGRIDPYDHWTTYTLDGKASAQWEHTLLITDTGYEILTLPD
ncbi:MAG: Methionine aminopeptidase [Chlamydiia bacterium]|nr:Methionine aminopeptidase [Chlamydiia bacterium]